VKQYGGDLENDAEQGESMFDAMNTRRGRENLWRGTITCKRAYRERMCHNCSRLKKYLSLRRLWRLCESIDSMCTRRGGRKRQKRYRGEI